MTKFNKTQKVKEIIETHPDKTTNLAGGVAFDMSPKLKLLSIIGSAMMSENKYYQTGKQADENLTKAIENVLKTDPEFVLKAAYWARTQLYMRSVPMYMIAMYANSDAVGIPGSRKYITNTIQRADEITELLALQQSISQSAGRRKGKWPMVIKNGVKHAFNQFDAYQFAKYDRAGAVTLRDALFITHPKPKDAAQQQIFNQIATDSLPVPDTWEVMISTQGSNHDTWTEMAPKLPYFALVRNLRNLLKNNVEPSLYVDRIANPELVAKSKMFPFRFFSAYKELNKEFNWETPIGYHEVQDALNKAVDMSITNIPKLQGRTAILVDVSGSMGSAISAKSSVTCMDIATLFGAMSTRICDNATVIPFGQTFKVMNINPADSIMTSKGLIQNSGVGHSTNAHLPIQDMTSKKVKFDRILLFSDMQCYRSSADWYQSTSFAEAFLNYSRVVNPNVKLYSVDLTGYGTTTVPENRPNVATISGWSDKIFNYITMFEMDKHTIVNEVEEISM